MNRIFIIFSLLTLFGCSKSYDLGERDLYFVEISDSELQTPTWNSPTFEIVKTKCASCHTAYRDQFVPSNTPSDFDEILDEDFFALNKNEILERIQDEEEPMPPNFATPLSSREKEALLNYLNSI